MQIELKKIGEEGLLVKADGKIDLDSAVEFGTTIKDAIEDNDIKDVVLDFEKVTYISSIGLRVILELHQQMAKIGTMKLTNVQESILVIFKMTGFDKFLYIE